MNPVDFVEQAQQEFFEQVAYYEEREKGLLMYIDLFAIGHSR